MTAKVWTARSGLFHTLKAPPRIVEFAAMARTLHAAEDILALLRSVDTPCRFKRPQRVPSLVSILRRDGSTRCRRMARRLRLRSWRRTT